MHFLDNGILVVYQNGWFVRTFNQWWYTFCSKRKDWTGLNDGLPFDTEEEALKIAKSFYDETGRLAYDPNFGDDKECAHCGHPYSRHFDPYENDEPVGCKYCNCMRFVEVNDED